MVTNLHGLAEARSLALHCLIAERLRDDPSVLDDARARVESWLETGTIAAPYARAWQEILRGSQDEIVSFLTSDSERARELRQVTPFAGVIDPRTRWRLWREVRDRAGFAP